MCSCLLCTRFAQNTDTDWSAMLFRVHKCRLTARGSGDGCVARRIGFRLPWCSMWEVKRLLESLDAGGIPLRVVLSKVGDTALHNSFQGDIVDHVVRVVSHAQVSAWV